MACMKCGLSGHLTHQCESTDGSEFQHTELNLSTGVSGFIPTTPCEHGELYSCLPCDVYQLNLRIYDLEDEVQRLKYEIKKLK